VDAPLFKVELQNVSISPDKPDVKRFPDAGCLTYARLAQPNKTALAIGQPQCLASDKCVRCQYWKPHPYTTHTDRQVQASNTYLQTQCRQRP